MPEVATSERFIREVIKTYQAQYRKQLSEEIKKGLRAKKERENIAKMVK